MGLINRLFSKLWLGFMLIEPIIASSSIGINANSKAKTPGYWQQINQFLETTSSENFIVELFPEYEGRSLNEIISKTPSLITNEERSIVALISGDAINPKNSLAAGILTVRRQGILSEILQAIWGRWKPISIPGAQCSDGSQYKIFTMASQGKLNKYAGFDKNLLVYLEPGGACWDYDSCSGKTGVRGAVNRQGIPDNYMTLIDYIKKGKKGGSFMPLISPLLLYHNPSGYYSQTSRWNKVFFPYCTGDVHLGNKKVIYHDKNNQNPPLVYRHYGAKNVELALAYLKKNIPKPNKLLVTGCSAGGTGALGNYHFFQKALSPKKSYLLNDSGPIFPSSTTGNQGPLQEKIKAAWNTSYTLKKITKKYSEYQDINNFGFINEFLAVQYPNDRMATILFQRDEIYSGYSYEKFYNLNHKIPADKKMIFQLWIEDIENLTHQFSQYENLSYFIPHGRRINKSHCATLLTYSGTKIKDSNIKVDEFINRFLSNYELRSYEEQIH